MLNILEMKLIAEREVLNKEHTEILSRLKRTQYVNKRNLDIERLASVDLQLKRITSGEILSEYTDRCRVVVEEYNDSGLLDSHIAFTNVDDHDDALATKRSELLGRFIHIVSDYLPVSVIFNQKHKYACKGCGIDLSNVDSDEETSFITCPNCCRIRYVFQKFVGVEDLSLSDYEDSANFKKGMYRFQGKANIQLPRSQLYKDLDDYFSAFDIPIGLKIKEMPMSEAQQIVGKKLMRKALSNKGYESFYEDINLIIYEYWGWEPPDISHLEDKIMDHYKKTEAVFKRIKTRKASINIPWRLKNHLLICSYPVGRDDFKMVVTREIKEYYEATFRVMCMESGDQEIIDGYLKIRR
jgi:hypothetical protein